MTGQLPPMAGHGLDAALALERAEGGIVDDSPQAWHGLWLDHDGDTWVELPDGRLLVLDDSSRTDLAWGGCSQPRDEVEKQWGPLQPFPAPPPDRWDAQ